MYWISVTALSAFVYFYLKGRKRNEPKEALKEKMNAVAKDSESPEEIFQGLDTVSDPWERHMIYTNGLDIAYKKRTDDQKTRDSAKHRAMDYIKEFPELKAAVFEHFGENHRLVSVFKQLAILFEEDREYEKALDICRKAMDYGLVDGTKTGYEGRMERLNRKLKAAG